MKTYLKQNDEGLHDDIRRIGCFWRSGLHIAELMSGEKFQAACELNILWNDSLDEVLIDSSLDLYKGVVPIIQLGLDYFGCNRKIVEVGTFSSGETSYYGWYRNEPILNPGERFYIQKVKLGDLHQEPYHYRVVDNRGEVMFDPYDPTIEPVGIKYSIILEEVL